MYERILVPLDGSKVGEAALPYIEELVSKLAPNLKVEVTLLQVISSTAEWVVAGEAAARVPYTEMEMEQIKKRAMDYLDRVGEGLRSKVATVNCRVGIGSAAEEIIRVTDEINADLVAMSTHGLSGIGIGRWAFGSVTAKVLRGGNSAVLMVRAPRGTTEA